MVKRGRLEVVENLALACSHDWARHRLAPDASVWLVKADDTVNGFGMRGGIAGE